jgi:hypothetical protein
MEWFYKAIHPLGPEPRELAVKRVRHRTRPGSSIRTRCNRSAHRRPGMAAPRREYGARGALAIRDYPGVCNPDDQNIADLVTGSWPFLRLGGPQLPRHHSSGHQEVGGGNGEHGGLRMGSPGLFRKFWDSGLTCRGGVLRLPRCVCGICAVLLDLLNRRQEFYRTLMWLLNARNRESNN